MSSIRRPRVLYVQGSTFQRTATEVLLKLQNQIQCVVTGDSEPVVMQHAKSFKPQIVVLGTGRDNAIGLSIVAMLQSRFPKIKILILDTGMNPGSAFDFLRAGVSGFVDRSSTLSDLLFTISEVANAKTTFPIVLSPAVLRQVIERSSVESGSVHHPEYSDLTARQKEVARMIEGGRSNKQIADSLCVSVHTVKSHVHATLEKLNLHSRLEMAHAARSNGSELVDE